MRWRISTSALFMVILAGPAAQWSSAQVSLADDLIIAGQGKENAARNRKPSLGRPPGANESPYRRSPGSSDVLLGVDPNRRLCAIATPGPAVSEPYGSERAGPREGRSRSRIGTVDRGAPPSPFSAGLDQSLRPARRSIAPSRMMNSRRPG